jgi:hypothetical protein
VSVLIFIPSCKQHQREDKKVKQKRKKASKMPRQTPREEKRTREYEGKRK